MDRLALGRDRDAGCCRSRRARTARARCRRARPHALGLRVVERVGRDVAGRERAVAEPRPGGQLERLVAVLPGPGGDLLERALRHAGGEEARASSPPRPSRSATHPRAVAGGRRTASVIRSARRPSAKDRQAVGASRRRSPRRSRDEGVEAVRVAPGGARGRARRRPRSGAEGLGVAGDRSSARAPADPERLRPLLVEGERLLRCRRARSRGGSCGRPRPGITTEPSAPRRSRTGPGRRPRSPRRAVRRRRRRARTPAGPRRDPLGTAVSVRAERRAIRARDELREVAPVRADVGERARRATRAPRRRASCRPRGRRASPGGRSRGSGAPRRPPAATRSRASRTVG